MISMESLNFILPLKDNTEKQRATELASIFKDISNIFVLGIGGSNLAAKSVYDAIRRDDLLEQKAKLLFIESPDKEEYSDLENFIKIENTAQESFGIMASSKSGETRETIESFERIFNILKRYDDDINKKSLVITKEDSSLYRLAKENKVVTESWSGEIGGRYSAFTKTHLIPIILCSADVKDFIKGAKENLSRYTSEDVKENTAFSVASTVSKLYKSGLDVLDIFIFEKELETLGKWCRQLIAESIGKKDNAGKEVGITPTISIGPRDLHSMLELYLGGPKNRFTIFIASSSSKGINNNAYSSTIKAYEEADIPFFEYKFDGVNEKEIGKFMLFFMMFTIYLAKNLDVNPFDQPAVEWYKKNIYHS